MRKNEFDAQVTNLVDGMKQQRDSLRAYSKDVTPYRSVKLSPEEEAQVFAEPWRLFPDEDSLVQPGTGRLTAAEAYSKLLLSMGPVEYVKWWDQHVA